MLFLLPLLLLACNGSGEDSGDGDTFSPENVVTVNDAQNFSYIGDLILSSTVTAEGVDLTFDWSNVENDLQCHGMDAGADVDNVAVMVFPNLTQEEVAIELSNDSMQQQDLGAYINYENTDAATTANLTDLSFFGTDPEILNEYMEGSGTLDASVGEWHHNVGSRIIHFIEPTASSDNTDVSLPDGCGMLDFEASLADKDTTPIRKGLGWVVRPGHRWTWKQIQPQ